MPVLDGPEGGRYGPFNLECDACQNRAEGSPHTLVDDGWNWAWLEFKSGQSGGWALCPSCSDDEETMDEYNELTTRLHMEDKDAIDRVMQ